MCLPAEGGEGGAEVLFLSICTPVSFTGQLGPACGELYFWAVNSYCFERAVPSA